MNKFKRIIFIILSALLLFSTPASTAFAENDKPKINITGIEITEKDDSVRVVVFFSGWQFGLDAKGIILFLYSDDNGDTWQEYARQGFQPGENSGINAGVSESVANWNSRNVTNIKAVYSPSLVGDNYGEGNEYEIDDIPVFTFKEKEKEKDGKNPLLWILLGIGGGILIIGGTAVFILKIIVSKSSNKQLR